MTDKPTMTPSVISDPIEWEFGVPASKVDLERIWIELGGMPAIYSIAYINDLKAKAPTVHRRLMAWAKERGVMTWANP